MALQNLEENFNTMVLGKYIPLDRKIKIAIGVAILILPIAIFSFLLFMPNSEKLDDLNKKKNALAAEIRTAKKAAAHLDYHEKELLETQKRFAQYATLLPKQKEIPNLLRNISDLGKDAGLDFLSFKPSNEIPKDFYAEIPVEITISGPYHNLGYFLDQVSKLDRIVTVNNIKMSNPRKEGAEMVLNSSCRLVTYMFTNTQTAPKENKKGKK